MKLKGKEEQLAGDFGTQGPQEDKKLGLLDGGFSFGLAWPRFGAEDAGNLEISMGIDKKKFPQKRALPSQKARKGAA